MMKGGLVLLLLTVVAYVPAFEGGFVWDDDAYVTDNATLESAAGLLDIWLTRGATPQYYPLVFTGFWLEHRLWGSSPTGYHVVNVLLHALAAILLWRVLRSLAVPGAWLAAAVFALHPVHVESVAWITERKNVLSAVFYLASAGCMIRFLGVAKAEREMTWSSYATALLLFVLALLSKTVTCTLPVAIALVLWWKRGTVRARDWIVLSPFLALGAVLGLATAWLERHHVGAVGPEWDLSLVERCLVAGRAVWFYAGKLVWPVGLCFNYPRFEVDVSALVQYAFPVAAVLVVALLWALRGRIGRGPLVAVLFFYGTLLPALGFVDVYPFRYSFVADHFQYLASVGPIALFVALPVALAPRVAGGRRIGIGIAVVVLALLAVSTWRQTRIYRDAETLWADTLAKNPGSWMAHNNLGTLLAGRGDLDASILHYHEALRIEPGHRRARYNLGNALVRQGKLLEAIDEYERALEIAPGFPEAHNNLGNALAKLGRDDEAIEHYARAVRDAPGFFEAQDNLANALAKAGRLDASVPHYEAAIALRPDHVETLHNFGVVLGRLGRRDDAIRLLGEALAIRPDYAEAHANLAAAYVADGSIGKALEHHLEAVRLTDGDAAAREAAERAASMTDEEIAREIEGRLRGR